MALLLETYTNPSTPSMRLNKPPLPPLSAMLDMPGR